MEQLMDFAIDWLCDKAHGQKDAIRSILLLTDGGQGV